MAFFAPGKRSRTAAAKRCASVWRIWARESLSDMEEMITIKGLLRKANLSNTECCIVLHKFGYKNYFISFTFSAMTEGVPFRVEKRPLIATHPSTTRRFLN